MSFERLLIIVLLLSSIFLNLLLSFEIKNLKNKLSLVSNETKAHQLTLGKIVKPLTVQDLNGNDLSIDYKNSDQPTIIYIFSPDCAWCDRNLQNIKDLYEKTQKQYRFIGVSVQRDSAVKHSEEKGILFPVFYNPSDLSRIEYNIRSTPSTYVISPDSKIIKFWAGAYDNATQKDVEDFFQVNLPGLNE